MHLPPRVRIAIGLLSLFMLLWLPLAIASAQVLDGTPPKVGEGEGETVNPKATTPSQLYAWTETQWQLTYAIVGFAAVLFAGQFAVMFASKTYWTDRQFKAFTLTLLLVTGLILIIAGFTDSQIAPMMGLIGTIAGYVLGASSSKPDKPGEQSEPKS